VSGIKEVRMEEEAQRPGRSGAPSDEPEARSEVRRAEHFCIANFRKRRSPVRLVVRCESDAEANGRFRNAW
jgi:hypothetical protein